MTGRPHSPSVDAAIDEIMDDMLEARWRVGRSHKAYAERYGVAVATVEGWAAQASRFLRKCRGNEEEFRERILASIEHVVSSALSRKRTIPRQDGSQIEVADPDHRSALQGLELSARVYGLLGHESRADGRGALQEPMNVPLDELRPVLAAAGFDLMPRPASGGERPS
jgi:hypothetical protein